jgi:hypothetical protein
MYILRKHLGIVGILLALMTCSVPVAQAQDYNKLSTDLAARIHAAKHSRVTVVDFLDLDKKASKLGKFLTLQLQTALSEPKHALVIVDQSQLPQLFDQMEKLNEGLIDPATGRQLGKVAGTEVLVVGTVMVSSASVRLDVKAIDLQTANWVAGGSETVSILDKPLLRRLAKEASGEETAADLAGDDRRTGSGTQVAKSPAGNSPQTPSRVRRDQGVIFELDGCSRSGDTLTCGLMVTSEGRDRNLHISFNSRTWNEAGDEYGPGDVTIANSSGTYGCPAKVILKNVPTHVSLAFPQFGGDASRVERLRLVWTDQEYCNGVRALDFEKIEVSADTSFSRASSRSGGSQGTPGGKRKGSILERLGGAVMDKLESTATGLLDRQVDKITGDDEKQEKPPQQ